MSGVGDISSSWETNSRAGSDLISTEVPRGAKAVTVKLPSAAARVVA